MNTTPTEAQEQTALFHWAAYARSRWPALRLMYAIPNGGSRNPIEGRHLKEQGVKAGTPDICLPCARGGYHGLYIEMKRTKGGRLSDQQREIIPALRAEGYRVEVCRGWMEAKDVITEYMEGRQL